MTVRLSLFIFSGVFGALFQVVAQTDERRLDPSGYLSKYDSSFNGIGPKVYVLPAPRTKKEELTDTYLEIKNFQDSINKAIRYQKLLGNLQATPNALAVQYIIQKSSSDTVTLAGLVEQKLQQNNLSMAYGLLNEYAKLALVKGDTDKALSHLQRGLELARLRGSDTDQAVFHANLATVYIIRRRPADAQQHEMAYYNTAVSNKNSIDQAQSLIKQALIFALDKGYGAAENTIIRRAIPLLNRAKFYSGKIWAWEMLADIYQNQNKHTEAQWFLIQARDLARVHQIEEDLAEIEYMLGYSKYIQQNFKVAQNEFKTAYKLADQEENDLLKLAIVEKLGNIYLMQNNIQRADDMLTEYWALRSRVL